jgi:hypothetical protein
MKLRPECANCEHYQEYAQAWGYSMYRCMLIFEDCPYEKDTSNIKENRYVPIIHGVKRDDLAITEKYDENELDNFIKNKRESQKLNKKVIYEKAKPFNLGIVYAKCCGNCKNYINSRCIAKNIPMEPTQFCFSEFEWE